MKFNEKLLKLRKEKGLSQEELGMEMQVSRQTVSKWEAGQSYPDFTRLVMLSDFFDMTLDELVKDIDVQEVRKFAYKRESRFYLSSFPKRGFDTSKQNTEKHFKRGSMVYRGQLYFDMPRCGSFPYSAYDLSGKQYILAYLLVTAKPKSEFLISETAVKPSYNFTAVFYSCCLINPKNK